MPIFSFVAGLFAVVPVQAASAASPTWDAPPGCPDRAALTQAVERRLGRSFAEGEVGLVGEVSQHAMAPRYRLRLELRVGGRSHTHALTAESCDSLVDAAAILVAVAYMAAPELSKAGPDVMETPETVAAAPVQVVDPIAEPAVQKVEPIGEPAVQKVKPIAKPELFGGEAIRPAVVARRAPKSGGAGVFVRVDGGLQLNGTPRNAGVAGGVAVAVGPLWRRARLEFRGFYLVSEKEALESKTMDGAKNTLNMSLFAGAVVGCGRLGRGRLEVPLCGGVELGGVWTTMAGPGAPNGTKTYLWPAGTVTAAVAWHAGRRWTFMLALHGLVNLRSLHFELSSPDLTRELFNTGWVSGRLFLGLELRFGDPW